MYIPNNPECHVDPSINIGRGDGVDEDGHYDETKDRTLLKRLKNDYPEAYAECIKLLGIVDDEN